MSLVDHRQVAQGKLANFVPARTRTLVQRRRVVDDGRRSWVELEGGQSAGEDGTQEQIHIPVETGRLHCCDGRYPGLRALAGPPFAAAAAQGELGQLARLQPQGLFWPANFHETQLRALRRPTAMQ